MTKNIKLIYIDEEEEEFHNFQRFAANDFNVIWQIPEQELQESVTNILENNPDMLIIDFRLNEYKPDVCYDGIELADAIHNVKFDLPCLILTSHTDDAMDQSLEPNTIHFKGELNNKDSKELLLITIKRNITVYHQKIEDSTQEHSKLLEKLTNEGGLTNSEESRLTELDEYLEKITNNSQSIPASLKKNLLSGQLNELIEDTRKLLKQAKRED